MADAEELEKSFGSIYKALDLKSQRKAMKGAMRREANRIKKMAVSTLAAKPIGQGTRRKLSNGIYSRVYPDRYGSGFMVSVIPRRGSDTKGIHETRNRASGGRGHQLKPVLMWAEDGTRDRHVGKRRRSWTAISKRTGNKVRHYNRSGHSTGHMGRYHFMKDTEAKALTSVENNLFGTFEKNLEKAARKQNLL